MHCEASPEYWTKPNITMQEARCADITIPTIELILHGTNGQQSLKNLWMSPQLEQVEKVCKNGGLEVMRTITENLSRFAENNGWTIGTQLVGDGGLRTDYA